MTHQSKSLSIPVVELLYKGIFHYLANAARFANFPTEGLM